MKNSDKLFKKPDLNQLKKLRSDLRKKNIDHDEYKEGRLKILNESEDVKSSIEEHNQIITELFNSLEYDYDSQIFSVEEFSNERKRLKKEFLNIDEPEDPLDPEDDNERKVSFGNVYFDTRNCIDEHSYSNPKGIIKRLKRKKGSFLIRETSESVTVIRAGKRKTWTYKSRFPRDMLYLFKMVKDDAKSYLNQLGGEVLSMPPEHPVTFYNLDYDDQVGHLTGMDINHAYWRIAFNLGVIREATYKRGLKKKAKALRLATLSVLGKPRTYNHYQNGEITDVYTIREADKQLQNVYQMIRNACYNNMYELSQKLGDDFFCWETDCIYYRNTPENISTVTNYLEKRHFTFKRLYYDWELE